MKYETDHLKRIFFFLAETVKDKNFLGAEQAPKLYIYKTWNLTCVPNILHFVDAHFIFTSEHVNLDIVLEYVFLFFFAIFFLFLPTNVLSQRLRFV